MYRSAWQILLWFSGLCLLSGCGYSLSHRLKTSFVSPRGIFVPMFDNKTEETGAERIFTNALIREMESHGNIMVARAGEGALELRGVVTGISYAPSVLSEAGFRGLASYRQIPVELGLNVGMYLALVDPKDQRVLWSNSFSGFRRVEAPVNRTYDFEAPSSLGLFTQSLIEARYQDVARDIMRDIYDDMVEFFPIK